MNIICFIAGTAFGIIILLFLQGASKTSHDHEIYMEGYNAGVERNQPLKPKKDTLGETCPVCNRQVWGYVRMMKYCSGCGQKIDWGMDDEMHNTMLP